MTSESAGLFRSLGPGSRIAGYLVEEQVGAGGMAVVFRARDEMLGRLAAVKVIAPPMAGDEEFRARFLRESRMAAAVDSLHIIPVYGAGEADGLLYIATRYVPGGDLTALMRRAGGRLEPARAVTLVEQVASALDVAHAAGLVHRDVKPQNILVDTVPERAEHVYLADFGLSKAAQSTGLTASGQFLGTPDYCAPEQIRGARVDGRADQYALGCVAFALLTGALPFHREETVATIFAHLQEPVPQATGLRPELPAAVDGVIAQALAKSPDGRYGRCGEFAAALREAVDAGRTATVIPRGEDTGYASTITRDRGSAGIHREHRRRGGHKALAGWAAGAAAVLAAGVAAVVGFHLLPPAARSPGRPPSHPVVSQASSSRQAPGQTTSQAAGSDLVSSRALSGSRYGFSSPRDIADDGTHIWVPNSTRNTVAELSAGDGSLIRTLSAGNALSDPGPIASDGTHLWVINDSNGSVVELSASDGSLIRTLPSGSYGLKNPDGIADDGTHLWITNLNSTVTELHASDGSYIRTLSGSRYGFGNAQGLTFDGTHIWVADGSNQVTEFNASDGTVVRIVKGSSHYFRYPLGIAFDGSHIWVTSGGLNAVTELSASGGFVRMLSSASYDFNVPGGITAAAGHVWIANYDGNSVVELTTS